MQLYTYPGIIRIGIIYACALDITKQYILAVTCQLIIVGVLFRNVNGILWLALI